MEKSAGLIYGPEYHYLDHLAPLCAQKKIPLYVTEEKLYQQAKTFYPDLTAQYRNTFTAPNHLVQNYDALYVCTPRPLFDEVFHFAQSQLNKRLHTIWCPHGNSDKGRTSSLMTGLKHDEELITYGSRIEAFIENDGIVLPKTRLGNYRLAYYQTHKAFYSSMLPAKKKNTLLYAPTWQDDETSSSFPDIWPLLLHIPSDFHLLVKLHPHLYLQFPDEISLLKDLTPQNVEIIEDFPPIYPLLAMSDLYIGDLSSVGYDFLSFKRPMILLFPSPLCTAGHYLPKENWPQLFATCRESLAASLPAHSLLEETFGECR